MQLESKTYTYEITLAPGESKIIDFSDDTSALQDRPFNFVRVITNQQIEIFLDNEKYFAEANTIQPIHNRDRYFYTIKIVNKSTTDNATVKLEIQRIETKTEALAGKILNILERLGL